MAEGGQVASSFPLPPMQFINLYTDENIRKGRAPKPPAPIKDQYTMFGVPFRADDQIIRSLESQGLRRLYPHNYDHKRELKKLNYSILVNFLDLLDVLIKAPDSAKRAEKIDDLTLLFIHMHHLINEFRPHQARETLRVMLDIQKKQRLETVDRFQRHLTHVQEMIQASLASLPDDTMLDSKHTIRLLSTSTTMSSILPPQPSVSAELLWSALSTRNKGDEEEGEGEGVEMAWEVKKEEEAEEDEDEKNETLDKMMCDIVDAMN